MLRMTDHARMCTCSRFLPLGPTLYILLREERISFSLV